MTYMDGDLISRKAVIDGIEELKKSPWANDNRNGYEYLIPEALGTVKDLCVKDCPSVFEGMTNGDIFTTIYPDHEAEKVGLYMVLRPKRKKGIGDTHILVDLDFWNAPYKGVSE